jgi:hypothetical protein
MTDHDEQFENFLREFEPVKPRALPEVFDRQRGTWRRFAAAAVLLLGCTLSARFAWNGPRKTSAVQRAAPPALAAVRAASRQASLIPLTQLAVRDPQRLDQELAAQSRMVLPRFDQPESTLRVLAKE